MAKTFYVTTPIYYVNDVPHIGHAYCTIAADTIARFKRLQGYEVLFLTGTDEHGQKVAKAAKERGLLIQEHVDKMVTPFKNLWKKLNISYDDFIRTTEARHEKVVKQIFQSLYDKGDIYKGKYEGWYCVYEESFYPQSQLVEGKCPECGRAVEWLEEEAYYFKTSKYQKALLKHIEKNPNFVQPEVRRNEVVSLLKNGVTDVCVSRTKVKWGVPVPFDKNHVIYVWFDALINYLSGVGYLQDDKNFKDFWPADIHLIGKDILKFHAIIWPSMLLAAGVALPKQVFATGFWTLGGEKISKSKGITIDPNALADEFGTDALRYFFLREISLGLDGEFTQEALIRRINFDLANDLGNLVHRTLPMVKKYCSGKIPKASSLSPLEEKLKKVVKDSTQNLEELMDKLSFREALLEIWKIVGEGNKYVDEASPWTLFKNNDTKQLDTVMNTILELIRIVAILISPFMPTTAEAIWAQLGIKEKLEKQALKDALAWEKIPEGAEVKPKEALFPRIET